jgi:predicted Rossmann fold flavoprotein
MFPDTDSSETIIRCFLDRARDLGIPVHRKRSLLGIEPREGGGFLLRFDTLTEPVAARAVCIATGSLKGSPLLQSLQRLDQVIEPLVPSLFAFNVTDARIEDLAGVSHPKVAVRREGSTQWQQGPLLITHRGFSGPAILRLSAWEARSMAETQHHFPFMIDWLPELSADALVERFAEIRRTQGAKLVRNTPIPPISRRLWERIVACAGIDEQAVWGQLPKPETRRLLDALKSARFEATGKTTNKDEFVTAGGIERRTVDFRTMESRVTPGLYFAGSAWTSTASPAASISRPRGPPPTSPPRRWRSCSGGTWLDGLSIRRYIPHMTTTIFLNGRSQAIRIPKELRFEGKEVSIRRLGDGVLLLPLKAAAWPPGYFESIRIDDEAFVRPDQGELPPVADFGA